MSDKNVTPKAKPLILAMQDAERGIANSVNAALQAGIPCYLLEMIFDKLHRQIKDGAEREMSYAIAQEASEAEEGGAPETEEQAEGA